MKPPVYETVEYEPRRAQEVLRREAFRKLGYRGNAGKRPTSRLELVRHLGWRGRILNKRTEILGGCRISIRVVGQLISQEILGVAAHGAPHENPGPVKRVAWRYDSIGSVVVKFVPPIVQVRYITIVS